MAKEITPIRGNRVYLLPLKMKNVTKEYLSWLNDSNTNKYLKTKRETMSGLRKYVKERIDRPGIFFAGIFDKQTDQHIGNVQIEIDLVKKRGALGILIGESDYRGRGIGTEVTGLVVQHAFRELKLNEVWLSVEADNLAGRRAYEKVGFKSVGYDEKTSRVTMSIKNDKH